ncbi:DUF3703 domain-containing protein [Noviherbaspirillum sp.]|mgnify:CR=1 FL=1|uniref:DUF3703 domain-containing protein n=1 Tax=Noviherbaspirillum sp. TaxID=1926288 RepID=UPI002FE31597
MNTQLRNAFDAEMANAVRLYRQGRLDATFGHLEIAHVLGQHYVMPHIVTHWWMLKVAIQRRSVSEVVGQAIRIVLGALGSAAGIVPVGNTGGTNISMFRRLPIDPALQKLMK